MSIAKRDWMVIGGARRRIEAAPGVRRPREKALEVERSREGATERRT